MLNIGLKATIFLGEKRNRLIFTQMKQQTRMFITNAEENKTVTNVRLPKILELYKTFKHL